MGSLSSSRTVAPEVQKVDCERPHPGGLPHVFQVFFPLFWPLFPSMVFSPACSLTMAVHFLNYPQPYPVSVHCPLCSYHLNPPPRPCHPLSSLSWNSAVAFCLPYTFSSQKRLLNLHTCESLHSCNLAAPKPHWVTLP